MRKSYNNDQPPNNIPVSIATVTDVANRVVTYDYNVYGDLRAVTDLRQQVTKYAYSGSSHLLTTVTDATNTVRLTNSYDSSQRVYQQVEPGLTTTYTYNASTYTLGGTNPVFPTRVTTIDQTTADGTIQAIDHYHPDGTLEYQEQAGQLQTYVTFDASVAPNTQVDGAGTATLRTHNMVGQPTQIIDALNRTTAISYRADNQPAQLVTPDGVTTTPTYDGVGNLTQLLVQGSDGSQRTTNYTYTGANYLDTIQAPDGVVTRYAYDALPGQITKMEVGDGTLLKQTTTYAYDPVGRLTDTTASGRTDHTVYNTDDTIHQTIANYQDGGYDAAVPDVDVKTSYSYDVLGRPVATEDVLGRIDATHYTAHDQVDWTIQNLTPASYDATGQPIAQAFSAAQPDTNVGVQYTYDGFRRLKLTTETGLVGGAFNPATKTFATTRTRTTRTEYDAFSRPSVVTLNYDSNQPIAAAPDVNLQTLTFYDGAGNVIWERDPLGRWTKMEYDGLERPVKTIGNYENGNPLTVDAGNTAWTDGSDTDLVSVTQYDSAGRVGATIDNAVDSIFTASDPMTDRITTYDYNGLGQSTDSIVNHDLTQTTRTDTNRKTRRIYDPTSGRLLGSQDVLGRWTAYDYDALGRVVTTIANCRNSNGFTAYAGCDSSTGLQHDQNLRTVTHYDGRGRPFETVDPLNSVTHADYDAVGRVTTTTNHYVTNGPTTADTNVTTSQSYDGVGRVLTQQDATGVSTSQAYDALDRVTTLTDAVGRVTRLGYDGVGTQRWNQRNDGQFTVVAVDGFSRPTVTMVNYQDGVVAPDEAPDSDLTTQTTYDVGGRIVQTTDVKGRVTTYTYNLRDQITSVTENVVGSCAGTRTDCNILTRYGYDRVGNRVTLTDARTNIRHWAYSAADELLSATDALNRTTAWQYDRGGRATNRTDPRGSGDSLTYGYDNMDRLTGVTAGNAARLSPISMQYDARGERTGLTDGVGNTTFGYDNLGRMQNVHLPDGSEVGYGYSARGERTSLTYPGDTRVTYGYWPDGRLHTVQEDQGPLDPLTLATYGYDAAGRLQAVQRANATATTYTYDGADRLRDQATTTQFGLTNHFAYDVDRGGLRRTVTETLTLDATPNASRFPTTPLRDDFERANGPVGGHWVDGVGSTGSSIQNGALTLTPPTTDSERYWADPLGADQEVYYTVGTVGPFDATTGAIDLLLKAKGEGDCDYIDVVYAPRFGNNGAIQVYTCETGVGWIPYGTPMSFSLQAGNTIGARAKADGTVEVYRNGALIGQTNIAATFSRAAKSGYVGISLSSSGATAITQFGGGTINGTFPATPMLDTFDRANGVVGGDWVGEQSFGIQNGTLVTAGNGIVYSGARYGMTQEVGVTFKTVDPNLSEIDMFLKVQDTTTGCNYVDAYYDPRQHIAQLWTCTNGIWTQHGGDIPLTLQSGDTFGARILADGTVEIYQNGVRKGQAVLSADSPYRTADGRVGVWVIGAGTTAVDAISGGTVGSFATTPILDDFNRADGAVGGGWLGVVGFGIQNGEVVTARNGVLYSPTTYGVEQEARLTFGTLDPEMQEAHLFLKAQDTTGCNYVDAYYVPAQHVAQVLTCTNGTWTQYGGSIPMTLQSGDTFGVRMRADGTVEIYQNDERKGQVQLPSTLSYRTLGGKIGMWLIDVHATTVTNFGGGTFSAPSYATASTRMIRYGYDDLDRLTNAQESGATANTYTYSYDKAGNRLDSGATYNAANQINNKPGYAYDLAGNLTNDGTTAYTYDALSRMTAQGSTIYGYNGNGVLLTQITGGNTLHYTQDLASPLPQVLEIGAGTRYLYGLERLAAENEGDSTKTWYGTDALGSVRQTLNEQGTPLTTTFYDPWGQVQQGSGAPFGFTGELRDGGLEYLRARWYNPKAGTFTGVDSFPGHSQIPYSQHPYQYGYSNPLQYRDPSGHDPDVCAWTEIGTCPVDGPSLVAAGSAFLAAGASAVASAASTAATACVTTVVCAVGVGAGIEVYVFAVSPNAAKNRADLVRGANYVLHGGSGYVRNDSATFSQEAIAGPTHTGHPQPQQPAPGTPPTTTLTPQKGDNWIVDLLPPDTQHCPLPPTTAGTPAEFGTLPGTSANQESWPIALTAKMSAELRKNMLAAAIPEPPGSAAHHIVAWDSRSAALARTILAREGVGINDAINGVFLPQNVNYPTVGDARHSNIHTGPYYAELDRRLLAASPGTVRSVLRQIAIEIERGTFPK